MNIGKTIIELESYTLDAGIGDMCSGALSVITDQAATIAEQLLTINALNSALGGEGTLTTDNLVRIARLEETIAQLQLDSDRYNKLKSFMLPEIKVKTKWVGSLGDWTPDKDHAYVQYGSWEVIESNLDSGDLATQPTLAEHDDKRIEAIIFGAK